MYGTIPFSEEFLKFSMLGKTHRILSSRTCRFLGCRPRKRWCICLASYCAFAYAFPGKSWSVKGKVPVLN